MASRPWLANLRDLGGMPVANGGQTRAGVLLRSDAPYADDRETGKEPQGWPPAVVVDLRGPAEAARQPRQWGEATTVHQHELYAGARPGAIAPGGSLVHLYQQMFRASAAKIAAVIDLLATDGATLVHCAAGKDRTGIVVAVLLALAGVEDGAIVADYQRTSDSMPGVLARLEATGNRPDNLDAYGSWLDAPETAIQVVLTELHSVEGGAAAWFASNGGNKVALAAWVDRFITHV